MFATKLLASVTLLGAAWLGSAMDLQAAQPAEPKQAPSSATFAGRDLAKASVVDLDMVPLRRTAAKPVLGETAQKHTVFQQSYPTQSSIEQGFQQQSQQLYNKVDQQRRTIGSEVARGLDTLVDQTGRVIRNSAQAVEGTAQNARERLQSVMAPPASQASNTNATGGYQPYNYNQPAPPANAYPTQTATQPTGTIPGYQPTAQPIPQTGQQGWAAAQQPPLNQAPQAPGYPTNTQASNPLYPTSPQQQPGYATQPSSEAPAHHDFFGDSDPLQSNQSMVNLRKEPNPTQGYPPANNQVPSTQTPNYNPPAYQAPAPTTPQGWSNQVATTPPTLPPSNTSTDPWGPWPTQPTPTSTQPQPPAQPTMPQQPGYGAVQPPQTGPDPSGWIRPIDQPTQSPTLTVGSQQTTTTGGQQPHQWFPLVLVAAIGSIAWNFYLGMNYIDARNKYRAALRRSGKAYADAFDDV